MIFEEVINMAINSNLRMQKKKKQYDGSKWGSYGLLFWSTCVHLRFLVGFLLLNL